MLFQPSENRLCPSFGYCVGIKEISLRKLASETNDHIRTTLKKVKGIGDWTVDVYLLFVLQRTDVFPIGDLAMVNAMKEIKNYQRVVRKKY